MKKKLTTEMARYIWSIIANDPSLPMSWGVDLESLECTDDALEFHVQGFIHTGNVRIVYIEGADLFQVSLYDEEGKETKKGRERRQKGEQDKEGREEGQVSRLITVLKKSSEVCT